MPWLLFKQLKAPKEIQPGDKPSEQKARLSEVHNLAEAVLTLSIDGPPEAQ